MRLQRALLVLKISLKVTKFAISPYKLTSSKKFFAAAISVSASYKFQQTAKNMLEFLQTSKCMHSH